MNSTNLTPFKILNASAGSGKTYALVKEYLLLLLKDDNKNNQFAQIVAMTFTNMAAIEMKERIIQNLDLLSFPFQREEESTRYATELARELLIDPLYVQNRAKRVLKTLLHNYEDFHVLTIDKFNLRLIRSFSRDLDLTNDFEVILNEREVIEQVVDVLFDQLKKDGTDELSKLVFAFAKSNLDEGEKWDFRSQLIDFGSLISKEKYQSLIERVLEMDLSVDRYYQLKHAFQQTINEFVTLCRDAHRVFRDLDLHGPNLPGAQTAWNKLDKLGSITVPNEEGKVLDNKLVEVLNGKELGKGKVFPDELKNVLQPIKSWIDQHLSAYHVTDLFLKSYFNMSLLKYIAAELKAVKKDQHLIRISEFNQLIANLVQHEEAPYIYERLGTRFSHFLLDEFQDTSRLQWQNIVPLIHESLGNGNLNLIVGDPKQSIYRFKNGVAEQFIALPAVYNPEKDPHLLKQSDFLEKMGVVDELGDNWRSSPEIVNFNNTLFKKLKDNLNDEAKAFYASIHQRPQSKKTGFIEIHSVESEKELDLDAIIDCIEKCKTDQIPLGDICILVQRNSTGNDIAIELNKRKYKVVSADSLLIAKDRKVQLAVSYLKRRIKPSSLTEQKRFAELYFQLTASEPILAYEKCLVDTMDSKGKRVKRFNESIFLTTTFGDSATFFCPFESIYELVQNFYKLLNWNELDNPFLHHFADFVHDYEQQKGPDIEALLDSFVSQKDKLAIQLPESRDAIQIMTIHKSKGLEFPVVILPKLGLSLSGSSKNKFLIPTKQEVLYSTLSKNNPVKEVKDAAEKEADQVFIDTVNLLYVALTRPKFRLYGFNFFKPRNQFGKVVHSLLSDLFPETVNEKKIHLVLGETSMQKEEISVDSDMLFEPMLVNETLWYPEIAISGGDSIGNEYALSAEQRIGNQFHLAISRINQREEITRITEEMLITGELEMENAPVIISYLERFFEQPPVQQLYTNAIEFIAEQTIIIDEELTKRPDKIILKANETVILDFKTGIPKPSDHKQMTIYKNAIQQMELPNVQSFLYYTATEQLIAV